MVNHKNPDDLIIQIHPGPREAAVPSISALGSGRGQGVLLALELGEAVPSPPSPLRTGVGGVAFSAAPSPPCLPAHLPKQKPGQLFRLLTPPPAPRQALPSPPPAARHPLPSSHVFLSLFVWIVSLLSPLFQCLQFYFFSLSYFYHFFSPPSLQMDADPRPPPPP